MNIKPFHFFYPDFKRISNQESYFEQVKNTFPDLKKEGIYLEGTSKSIFIYRIKSKLRSYQGILAAIDIHDYLKGLIKKHENTLTQQEENISQLMKERSAMIKPVLIAYNERVKIKELMARCIEGQKPKFKLQFEKDQQVHEFFEVTDKKQIAMFQKEFKTKIQKAYIADGHHRMAAVCKFILQNPDLSKGSLNYIMCALFDFNELSILPYNRLITVLDQMTLNQFLMALGKYATVSLLAKPRESEAKNEVVMIVGTDYYTLNWNREVQQYFKQKNGIAFDIDIFNELVLQDILGIQNIRASERISYVEGIKGLRALTKTAQESQTQIGFSFFPVRRRDFVKVADEHMVLPPKSTWFEPRIRNGIVVQDLDLQI